MMVWLLTEGDGGGEVLNLDRHEGGRAFIFQMPRAEKLLSKGPCFQTCLAYRLLFSLY